MTWLQISRFLKNLYRKGMKRIFKFHRITFNNKVYFLRITEETMRQIENKLGKAVFSGLKNITDNMITSLVATLWGAMLEYDTDFTFEQAASLFDQCIDDGHSFDELTQEINGLLKTAGFALKDEDQVKAQEQQNKK